MGLKFSSWGAGGETRRAANSSVARYPITALDVGLVGACAGEGVGEEDVEA